MAVVLVTEGGERAALAVVRSLGRAGHRVHVVGSRTPSLAGVSRHAAGEHQVPDPLRDADGYRTAVAERVRALEANVLLPTTEAGLLALLPLAGRLGRVALPFPSIDAFRRVCDKAEVLAVAPTVGIAVPEQAVLATARDLESERIPHAYDGGLVVKPSRSVVGAGTGFARNRVVHARDRAELERLVRRLPETAFPVLVQRAVRGDGIGVFLLIWDGKLLGAFAHRRIREKPPSGGVSVLCESVAMDAELLARSRALLARFGWRGAAMVEYKLDERSDTPVLMEINGRFWGSLQLAVDSGVDFPRLLVAAALGEPVEPVLAYRSGVRSRWWWGEVDHLLTLLRVRRGSATTERSSPGRTLQQWLVPARSDVFRWSDPAPFARETADWLRQAAGR